MTFALVPSPLSRKSPSPAQSNSFDNMMTDAPGAVEMSSHSSPGSASDHMGTLLYTHEQQPSPSQGQQVYPGSAALAETHVNRVITTDGIDTSDPATTTTRPEGQRRQKRLQRNRESARLSRRRRKQYLEVLEERVDKHSQDLDKARRAHVQEAVATVRQERHAAILHQRRLPSPHVSRTHNEFMVVNTFQEQQWRSMTVPPHYAFVQWLTLQTEPFFRGGRAASERLSAARIGERMLSSGTFCAAPSQSMWPLFCNEVGLSYDQEEKVRNFQRTLLQDPKTWLDRHTHYAAKNVIGNTHDAIQALTLRCAQREQASDTVLSDSQRLRLLQWSTRNRDRVTQCTNHVATQTNARSISPETQHVAVNLYVLNERLSQIPLPRAAPIATGAALKRLSRRPAFESLGAQDEKSISRGDSSGSLKRSASEMSMEAPPAISPVAAQAASAPTVTQVLAAVHDLLPRLQAKKKSSLLNTPTNNQILSYQAPVALTQSAPQFGLIGPGGVGSGLGGSHQRKNSFLPLNVVPEEMWPADEAEDFLLDMIDGDWGIGEGVDMDTGLLG